MVVRHSVEGYDNFLKFMEDLKADGQVIVIYSGSKLDNGLSWCSDCVEAEPAIEEGLKVAPESSHIVHVEVGDRAYWKDFKCPFRTNPKTKLNVLPTMALWGTHKRLEGEHLLKADLVKMLVTNEDD
ncbi:thioredoxin domain-containing protein 17 [Microplitis mediator]|uniref:thioredoxin domain-containing protein 17 n=1 Tax=Microplitis mediator TaxID=375433 RepID=UPI002552328C|nr:thioredoxin domain-containing protein 17 [Microplitis mediator]